VSVHEHLAELGAGLDVGAHGLVALDWESGNRSVLVDHELSGALVGMTLATRAHEIYWALIEATAFGTRKIIDTFAAAGVPVREFVAAGGLLRNEPLMHCYGPGTGARLGHARSGRRRRPSRHLRGRRRDGPLPS
jgi:L-ribulokinase